jgi:hypothetical protein
MSVGEIITAFTDVPDLIEYAIRFHKGEVCEVCEITARSIAIRDRFGDIDWFSKSAYRNGNYIGDFFE